MRTIDMRGVAIAVTALAVGSSPVALFVSALHQPAPGVVVSDDSARVAWVLPGGPAWNDGVRAGQRVQHLEHGTGNDDWRLVVIGPDGIHYATSALSHRTALRAMMPMAAGSVLFAGVAAVAVRRRLWPLASAVGVLAILGATWPIMLAAQPVLAEVAAMGAIIVPVIWLAATAPRGRWQLAIAAALASLIALAWLFSRLAAPGFYPATETARLLALGVAAAVIAWQIVPWRGWLNPKPTIDTSPAGDLAGMVAAGLVAVLLAMLVELPLWLSGAAGAAAAAAYPPLRRRTVRLADRILFADRREQARIAAVEDERVRVAAEIHDVPLQEIAGIIRRLERSGDAETETDLLRGVAAHLRDITGELYPPVLADLGVGPALAAAAEEADRLGSPRVTSNLRDASGILPERRAPRLVELAVYRIVSEAMTNARLHAGASSIALSGVVSPSAIEIVVRDNGMGFDAPSLRSAQRAGHLGVTSMAQRAESIGADLRIEPADPGTAVTVTWRRP